MTSKKYDVIILGGGVAGLSAAIYCGRALLDTLVIEKDELGGNIANLSQEFVIPGFTETASDEIIGTMVAQLNKYHNVKIVKDEIKAARFKDSPYRLESSTKNYYGDHIIVATGTALKGLSLENEERLIGNGISYCSVCDGALYTHDDIVVVGGHEGAENETLVLSRYARHVYFVNPHEGLRTRAFVAKQIEDSPKITVYNNSRVIEVDGKEILSKVVISHSDNRQTILESTKNHRIGLFMFSGEQANTSLFRHQFTLDDDGYIITNTDMETNIKNIYAAGDVRRKSVRQIVTSINDGVVAATTIERKVAYSRTAKIVATANPKDNIKNRGKSLNALIHNQVRQVMNQVDQEMNIWIYSGQEQTLEDIDFFIDALSSDTGKVVFKVINHLNIKVLDRDGRNYLLSDLIESGPAMLIMDGKGIWTGITYFGLPLKNELLPFCAMIQIMASKESKVAPELLEAATKVPVNKLTLAVNQGCRQCPDMIIKLARLVRWVPNLKLDIVDISFFTEWKNAMNLTKTPSLLANNTVIVKGNLKEETIIQRLIEASEWK